MNNALTFLGIAAAIAVIGGVVVALVHRRPEGPSTDGVHQFQRFMDALAPDEPVRHPDAGPAGDGDGAGSSGDGAASAGDGGH